MTDAPRNRRLEALEAIYTDVPHIECQRLCRGCCGPVMQTGAMSAYEHRRITALGMEPSPVDPKDFMACSMLDGATGLCRVYDRRPMVCRLWGVVEDMPCPFGCQPERLLTRTEGRALMQRALELGGTLG